MLNVAGFNSLKEILFILWKSNHKHGQSIIKERFAIIRQQISKGRNQEYSYFKRHD